MINRLIFWLSLAGIILSLHLWVQKARGFDQGCLGLESHPVPAEEGGCAASGLQAGSHLLGVSNAAWGYAFYFSLAALSFGKIILPARGARWLHRASEALVLGGLVYSGYLLYFQAFVAGAFCVLCLTSMVLVIGLFGSHLAIRIRGGYQPLADGERGREIGFAGGALFLATGVLLGVMVFVNRLGTRPLDQGNGALEMRRIVGRMLPAYIAPEKLNEMRACHFDGMAPPFAPEKFVGPQTPFLGRAGGTPVIVFVDPNCPHCKSFYATFRRLAEKYGDRARFYLLPQVLWDFSVPSVAALKLAEKSDKYFELWREELATRGPRMLTVERLGQIYTRIGLDAANLSERIAAVTPEVMRERSRVRNAGIDTAPTIFIGEHEVFSINYSEECLGTLIEAVLAADARRTNSAAK